MAQITLGAKLAAALITGGSLLGLAATSGTLSVPGLTPNPPAMQAAALPGEAPLTAPDNQVQDQAVEPPVAQEVAEEAQPEVSTALLIPQAPVLSGPPSVAAQPSMAAPDVVIPSFDLLRVEPDGSVVIVGNAAPGAVVDAITGSRTLGSAMAAANGDFVIIFEEQLAPGDYNIVLRADDKKGTAATSVQTAIVSIPQQGSDGILALVEEPGAPSRLISTGQGTAQPLAAATQVAEAPAQAEPETAAPQAQAPVEQPAEQVASQQPEPTSAADVRIEAVEIDGKTVFVAGQAEPGAQLRVYANDLLLGQTTANPDGTFLVQVNRDLPVGDYMVRADLLGANGADVVMRAAVPFVREPGEKLAAVAVPPAVGLPNDPPSIAVPPAPTDAASSNQAQSAAAENASVGQAGVETQMQQPLKAADSSVIIRRGDTLWQISRRVYGQGVKYTTIYNANVDQIRDPDRIWPGQIFAVPQKADADAGDAVSVN